MSLTLRAPAVALVAIALALPGKATFAVTMCTIGVTPMVFGNYNPVNGPALQVDATVTATCTTTTLPLAAVQYSLQVGVSTGSGTMARQLAGPNGSRLSYNVYTSAAYATVWGDGTGGTSSVSGGVTPVALGVPAVASHTAFGRVPALQAVRVGAYGDSLLVTILY